MPEYVYALFDFVPENPDEIHFKTGDRIEVIERDDVYSDGWWQVSPFRSVRSLRSLDIGNSVLLVFRPLRTQITRGKGVF